MQWLRLHASNARGTGLIPGRGTKILGAALDEAKKEIKKKKKKTWQFPGGLELWAFTAMGLGQKKEYKIESVNKTNQIYFKMYLKCTDLLNLQANRV